MLSKSVNRNLLGLMEHKNITFHEDISTLYYYNLNYIFRSISMAVLLQY